MKTTLLLGGAFCALALPALADITVTDLRGRTTVLLTVDPGGTVSAD